LNRTLVSQTKALTAKAIPQAILQRKIGACVECRDGQSGLLQRKSAVAGLVPGVPPIVHEVLGSSGQPLDAGTRAFMEPRFGHDFSQVRVHTGERAYRSAEAVNALAYTVGTELVFAAGRYAPGTEAGRKLLAHELTHVVQQASASPPARLTVGAAEAPAEQAAEAAAERAMQAGSGSLKAEPLGQGVRQIQRQPADPGSTEAPAATPLAPGSEKKFSAEGVNVTMFRRCDSTEFGFDAIEAAARSALAKVANSDNSNCISEDRRTRLLRNLQNFGMNVFCRMPAEMGLGPGRCAESTGGTGNIYLSSIAFPQNSNFNSVCGGGNLAVVLLHEITHIALPAQFERLPRSCENSCFGNDRGESPDLCRNPRQPDQMD
jgi:hypothetical protein